MAIENVRDPVNGVPFKSSASGSITDSASLADTFDTFLTLLTTQLKHQDPLNPMDTNEFTSQLVEFTNVEQAMLTNKKLDSLLAMQTDMQLNDAVGYIHKKVGADGIILMLEDGESTITYDLGANAAETNILIIDEEGNTVRTPEGDTEVGHHANVGDGIDDDGEAMEIGRATGREREGKD